MFSVYALSPTTVPLDPVIEALEERGQVITAVDAHGAQADRCAWASIRCGGHPIGLARLRDEMHAVSDALDCDIAVFDQSLGTSRPPQLAIFDLDGTLLQCEGIDELAREAGRFEEVAAVTAQAMRGELDFTESFTKRIGCLAGLEATAFDRIIERLPFTQGLGLLADSLRAQGCRLVIASGGFVPFAEAVAERFGFDAVHANTLVIDGGQLTGTHHGPIVDAEAKAHILANEAATHGIDMADTIAVGDGANDLRMLSSAGRGIAFHAKPVVRERCGIGLQRVWLDGVLPLCGL